MTEQELNIIIFNKNDNLESYNLNPGIDETSNNENFVSSFDHTSYKNKLDKYNQEIKNASEDSVYKERRDKVIQNRMEMINDDTITKIKTYIQEYCPNITLEEPIDGIEAKIQQQQQPQPLALANVPFNPTTQQPPTTTTNVDNQEGKKDIEPTDERKKNTITTPPLDGNK